MFQITDHLNFDAKGRAVCPVCIIAKGSGHKAKNLSLVGTEGAYKCHRGCTSEEIRSALGQDKDRIIPTALVKPAPNVTVTTDKISEAHIALLKNNEAMGWLDDRGIDRAAVEQHHLGLTRSKQGDKFIPAISIPIPADGKGNFYQKKRIAPWVPAENRPKEWSAWSQYGIPQMVYFTHKPEGATETWLCEGEWDAIRLAMEFRTSKGTAIACFTCGAGNVPPKEQLDRLPGNVYVLYDRDEPGRKGALKLQERLKDQADIVTIPDAPGKNGTPEGWDISDLLNSSPAPWALSQLNAALAKAESWTEPKRANPLRSRLQTNDEMIAGARDHVDWLVTDILTPDELFILGTPPRVGKSIFGLTLAKAVATGSPFLDRPVTQGSVLYINLEDSPTKVKQRQIAQGWADNLPVYWMDKFKLSELNDLRELADEIPDLRLVILDTFSRIRDDNQKESSAELGKILEPLQEWAKERGVCVLLMHHTGKVSNDNPSTDPFDTLRGSSSIRATCRGAMVIIPGESSYRLLAENGYTDRLDVNIRIKPETLEWSLIGNWTPRIDGDMKEQILDHLNLVGEATVSEVAKNLNFNANSVSTIMSRLTRDGVTQKKGGTGRNPARYMRSSNLLKQLETQFEHPKPDPVSDTDLLKQKNFTKTSDEKVIISPESDHSNLARNKCDSSPEQNDPMITFASNDHFSSTHTELFEQSHNPDGVRAVCSNSNIDSLSKLEQTVTTPKLEEWVYWKKIGTVVKVTKKAGKFAWIKVPGQRNLEKVEIAELGEK